jgi:hypothetical protein
MNLSLIDTDIWIDILRGEIGYPLTLDNWREARRTDGSVSNTSRTAITVRLLYDNAIKNTPPSAGIRTAVLLLSIGVTPPVSGSQRVSRPTSDRRRRHSLSWRERFISKYTIAPSRR